MEDLSEEEQEGEDSADDADESPKDEHGTSPAVDPAWATPPVNQHPVGPLSAIPERSRSESSVASQVPASAFVPPAPSTSSSVEGNAGDRPWSSLPRDQRFYLDYHRLCLTHSHYQFKHDSADFVHSTLLTLAMKYSPLRYAVVGFAAFHHTVSSSTDGKLTNFLTYYNQSISLLRKSLAKGQRHTMATLLTILQLAATEVRLCLFPCTVHH